MTWLLWVLAWVVIACVAVIVLAPLFGLACEEDGDE